MANSTARPVSPPVLRKAQGDGYIYVVGPAQRPSAEVHDRGCLRRSVGVFWQRSPASSNLPWGAATDASGNVYVADWRNDRIQKFTADGDFLTTFGTPGYGEGQLQRPHPRGRRRRRLRLCSRLGQREGADLRLRRAFPGSSARRGHRIEVGAGIFRR